ncbi:MAG: hypothetical protein ACP5OK_04240 [Thermoprotei archaeon]
MDVQAFNNLLITLDSLYIGRIIETYGKYPSLSSYVDLFCRDDRKEAIMFINTLTESNVNNVNVIIHNQVKNDIPSYAIYSLTNGGIVV